MSKRGNDWCILRTAGQRTLALVESLVDAGMDAWTPTLAIKRRAPRKPSRVAVEVAVPMMPTFVFVRAVHVEYLHGVARLPVSPHPRFAFFRYDGRIPLLAEVEVDRLKMMERKAMPKRRRSTVPLGTQVIPSGGAYAGMTGAVIKSDGKLTTIAFGSWMDVKVETFILLRDDVRDGQPITGIAA